MKTKPVPDLPYKDRCDLIDEVGQKIYNETETWGPFGVELAYLFLAIANRSFVAWDHTTPYKEIRALFKRTFPEDHPVWNFILL